MMAHPGARQGSLPAGGTDVPTDIPSHSEVWAARSEVYRLRDQLSLAHTNLRELERRRALAQLRRLSPHQRVVLSAFADGDHDYFDGETCYYFATIQDWTGLNRTQVSRACKALWRLGFLSFHRGLFNEDGEVAGSGYCISKAGLAWWQEHESADAKGSDSSRLGADGEAGSTGTPPETTTTPPETSREGSEG